MLEEFTGIDGVVFEVLREHGPISVTQICTKRRLLLYDEVIDALKSLEGRGLAKKRPAEGAPVLDPVLQVWVLTKIF